MSLNSRLANAQAATAATAVTGAPGATLTGTALSLLQVEAGTTVVAKFTMSVKTSSVVLTPSLEVSYDGTNYDTIQTGTATAAGNGGAVVTKGLLKEVAPPYRWIRGKVTVSGTTGTADDTAAIEWNFARDTGRG